MIRAGVSRLGLSLQALLLAAVPAAASDGGPALLPAPASLAASGGTLAVGPALDIAWKTKPSALLGRAAGRFAADFRVMTGLPLVPGAEPVRLTIACAADPKFLQVGEHEHYRLVVAASGISLDADGPAGVLDGLSTLLQLVTRPGPGAAMPLVAIDDAPRFMWRGLMIDTARHFMRVATIERQLDAMERVKLNVLHLHLSDAQGFRVESHVLPRLTQRGSHGEFYTQDQVRALVRYAADRGIRIVPEFDLPGHALSLLQAYPALAAASLDQADRNPEPDSFAINPVAPGSLRLVSDLYAEMALLFPDQFFHAGGDEVEAGQWTGNPAIVAYMARHHFKDPAALQGWFTGEIAKSLARHGKTMIGWDEVLAAPVPKNVAVEVWRSSKWIAQAAKAGHPVVVSAGYYLDLMQPAAQHYLVDPLDPRAIGLSADQAKAQAEAEARTNAQRGDASEPSTVADFMRDPDAVLPPEDAHLVLGGEAPLWTENVSDEMLDGRLWPRAAAIAERFWSGASRRDVADMQRRMFATEDRLVLLGLQSQGNQARMIDRLAPGDTASATILAGLAAPVRNYALHFSPDRSLDNPTTLAGIADLAAPDQRGTILVGSLVDGLLAGDDTVAPRLRSAFAVWRDNDASFEIAAAAHPALAQAAPASRALASLGQAGLAALDAWGGHKVAGWLVPADAVIGRLQADIAASADTARATTSPQPAADLLLPGVDAVARLVDAARRKQPVPTTGADQGKTP